MEKAVQIAKEKTEKWKVCVLSPGAPSLNMFKNFEERGNLFKLKITQ
jgi:UDP-N-acetylmuramoylalanine-D-glutamate ligase